MTDFFGKDPFKTFFEDLERETAPFWNSFESRITEAKQALHKVNKNVTDGVVTLETDLPGVKKKDMKLTFLNFELGGTRIIVNAKRGENEIKFAVNIKETVLASEAVAELSNGVLRITVPVFVPPVQNVTEVKVS